MAEGKIAIRIARQFPTARNLPSSSSHLTIYHLLFVFFYPPSSPPKRDAPTLFLRSYSLREPGPQEGGGTSENTGRLQDMEKLKSYLMIAFRKTTQR